MKAAALLFAIIAIVWCAVIALRKPAHAHDWYMGLKNSDGESCCDRTDFKPVRAWQGADGIWIGVYDGIEYRIPPHVILEDRHNLEPFQAHMAVRGGRVRCFLRKASGG